MIYDTDQIKLYAVTKDSTYGNITKAAAVTYDCCIEDTNRIIKSANGQDIKPNALILVDDTFTGVKGDIITLFKKFGTATGDTKEYEIIEVFVTGGMSVSHKEVLV
jgi:hypothetical protein